MSKLHALETIGNWAFAYCSALVRVMLAPNLKTIGQDAFCDCTSLEEADMSKLHALETIGMNAFGYCSALVRVMLSPNLKTIGNDAFSGCKSLEEADMSKLHALETIGDFAFSFCSALVHVMLAPNLKTIGNDSFSGCKSLEEADISKLHALEAIGDYAFQNCSALARVMLAPSGKTIGESVFKDCTNLNHVMIPLRHHLFVQELPFDETHHKLLSVDMEGHDLKKAIRIKNLYPRATPNLTTKRLVSMYAKSPLAAAELVNAAQNDDSVTEEDWEETREEDLQRLEKIGKVYVDSVFKLVHWYAGNGLVKSLFMNRREKKRDSCNDALSKSYHSDAFG